MIMQRKHDELSRPQKRRRRLQREAVRNALINTANVKETIPFLPPVSSKLSGVEPQQSSVQDLEMKVDVLQANSESTAGYIRFSTV